MFGVLRGCSHRLSPAVHQEWWSHICGLCLTLRDHHGQAARITTNFDAALLSVLYAAQMPTTSEHHSSVCALRGFRRLEVVASSDVGARYAAAVSLLIAATRLRDHASDGDGWSGQLPRLAGALANRWDGKAAEVVAQLGFDSALIYNQTTEQARVEHIANASFSVYAAPTEAAVGAAFRHTAVLAQQPDNAAPLEQIGRMYRRMMLLLDSYRDYVADQARGHFNALAGYDSSHVDGQARAIFNQSMSEIRQQWTCLKLAQPHLAQTLLLEMLPGIGGQTLHQHTKRVCASAAPLLALPLLEGGSSPPEWNGHHGYAPIQHPMKSQGYVVGAVDLCCFNPVRRIRRSCCNCGNCCDCSGGNCCDVCVCSCDCCECCSSCDCCGCGGCDC